MEAHKHIGFKVAGAPDTPFRVGLIFNLLNYGPANL